MPSVGLKAAYASGRSFSIAGITEYARRARQSQRLLRLRLNLPECLSGGNAAS